ncbi:hypothetical protein J1G32_08815 [Pseudomonas fluorescens]|nr:hypothetical protein [Pseudomonas fluorescens]
MLLMRNGRKSRWAQKTHCFPVRRILGLLEVLRSCFPAINLAFVLDWVPEQGEDIYWVLIDNSRVAMIERFELGEGLANEF